ncbi:MAG: TIGR00269 family protein [Methanospirillaceae archaeon]|nr:TIGR00269 family protein [Methanospirillaceae archaeon]
MERDNHCSFCSRAAVILGSDEKTRLCQDHLLEDLLRRVNDTIQTNNLIQPGDHIAVALSGGKDSTALILLLSSILKSRTDITVTAITIDEGITGYREETLQNAKNMVKILGINHYILSFAELFGKDLDHLLLGKTHRACTICGVLRRKALTVAARTIGATKIATGHNRDDEAQSVLMNVMRGDITRLVQDSREGSPGLFLPRIKPLSAIYEKELLIYLYVTGHYIELPECPYASTALRREIREIISLFRYKHPEACDGLIDFRDKVRNCNLLTPDPNTIQHCRICKEPCNGDICQACLILRPTIPKYQL